MKKHILRAFLAAFTTTAIILSFTGKTKANSYDFRHEYPETFIVVAVDQEHDFITLQDFNGFTWNWNGCEDWMIGDIASAIMDSKGTEAIQDDEILELKYSGYIAEP